MCFKKFSLEPDDLHKLKYLSLSRQRNAIKWSPSPLHIIVSYFVCSQLWHLGYIWYYWTSSRRADISSVYTLWIMHKGLINSAGNIYTNHISAEDGLHVSTSACNGQSCTGLLDWKNPITWPIILLHCQRNMWLVWIGLHISCSPLCLMALCNGGLCFGYQYQTDVLQCVLWQKVNHHILCDKTASFLWFGSVLHTDDFWQQ